METTKKGFTKRKKKKLQSEMIYNIYYFVFFMISITIIITLVDFEHSYVGIELQKDKSSIVLPTKFISICTVYHPNIKECGSNRNIGYFGDTLKKGDCAVSSYLLDHYLNYLDSIQILTGALQGVYCVKDKASSSKSLIDVWRPNGDKLKASYKTIVKIKLQSLKPIKDEETERVCPNSQPKGNGVRVLYEPWI